MTLFKAVAKVSAVLVAADVLLDPKTRKKAEDSYLSLKQQIITPEFQKKLDDSYESVRSKFGK